MESGSAGKEHEYPKSKNEPPESAHDKMPPMTRTMTSDASEGLTA
jgi:hypothetical protein